MRPNESIKKKKPTMKRRKKEIKEKRTSKTILKTAGTTCAAITLGLFLNGVTHPQATAAPPPAPPDLIRTELYKQAMEDTQRDIDELKRLETQEDAQRDLRERQIDRSFPIAS